MLFRVKEVEKIRILTSRGISVKALLQHCRQKTGRTEIKQQQLI